MKIGFNFAKTDKLKYNLSTTLTGADINKDPYNPQAPVGGAYIGWGYDTTGLGGGKTFGYSTNGKNFYALVGPKGLVVRKSDGNRLYGTIADQIDSAISANVIPAKSAADSAVAYANDAIEKSKVNSQAIDDINSAVSDAKQGANDAMSRAVSAWDAAQSNVDLIDSNYASASASISSARTEALAAADEAKKSASAAQADIVVVKSSVAAVQAGVATTRSDVAVAKSDIADTKAGLTIQAKSLSSYAAQASAAYNSTASALSDAKTAFSSDVAETKKLANTAQATADSAVESASENAKELASQANALSDAKKAMDSDVASAKELANAAQATADSAVESASSVANNLAAVASQANANANGITKVTSDVGLLQTTVADNTGDISTIQETAKQIQQAVSDNSGNITVAKQTADSAVAVASDAKSNATVAVQTASGASLTATNAQGDATTAMTTANSAVIQASDAKSNATVAVQTASEASLTAANAKGDASIAKQTASDASVQIKNAQGDIAQLKTRADGFDAEFATANGNISKLQTDATGTTQTLANTKSDVAVLQSRADGLDAKYADAAGDINTLKTNASGFSQTLTNAQGDISTLKSTVSGVQTTLTNAQGNISTLQSDVSGLKKTTSDNAGNISTLQSTANTLTSQMSSAQGDISTLKQTASGISSQVSGMSGDLNNLKSQAQWVIVTDTVDLNNIKTPCHEFLKGGVTNAPNETAWWYLTVEGSEDDRITQTVIADQSNNRYTRRFADSWSAWVRDATQTDVTSLSNLITANTTAINQNKNAITLKADQTAVDKINGTVSQLQSSLTVQAEQIQEKVTSSQVTGMLSGYATQDYTQSLVTQKADEWNVNLTKLKNDTQTSLTQLAVGVEGVQAQVYNSDGSSKITQLSNLIATKVSQDDYNSQITQLKNDINLRVAKGDVISQINQEAGGDTLIQVSNGKKSLILDAGNTIITGKAWIPDAAISSISADKIMLGSSALYNSDGTLNLVNQSNDLKALIQVKQGLVQDTTQSIISFSSDYNNRAFSVTPVGATVTPTLFFERYDQTAGHWLGFTRNEVRRDGLMFNTWDNDGERFFVACHARFDRNISATGNIYQGSWNGTTGKPLAGVLSIQSGNTIWSGSDFLAIGDHLSNSFTNVMARSFSQQSTLSSKTNIETVDPKDALDLVNRTDIRSYQYKTDVAEGKAKRYTSLIIDDVNDVSKYYAPDEFTNEERTGRDDGSAVGYLFLAIQELTRRIKTLEEKLNG